jgi:peptidoglycan/xylan/chitin deacetylase (PgdA/CDA1 family)
VVYRAVSGPVAVRTLAEGTWSAPQYVGGAPVGAPGAVRVGATLHVLVRRGDGTLWHRAGDGTWSPWREVGGTLSSSPAVVGRGDGRLDVFARGPADGLRWVTYRPSSGWGAWQALGGHLATAPAAVRTGRRGVAVCAAASDFALTCRRMTGGTWGGWAPAGGSTRSTPALALDDETGTLHLLFRTHGGVIGHRVHAGGTWSVGTAPAAAAFDGLGATTVGGSLLVAGLGPERNLHAAMLDGGAWSSWQQGWPPSVLPAPAASLLGRVVTRIPTSEKVVALTFDGGSGAQAVGAVRRTLQARGVPATAFLSGDFYRDHPGPANALATTGLRFGNHSDTHPYFTRIPDDEAVAELVAARTQAMRTTGVETKPLFRFPYGDYAAADLAVVNREGYVAVGWTVDTLGWKGAAEGITASQVVRRVVADLRPGAIVLMHLGAAPDGSTLDADALPRVIDAVRARGYRFVTLRALSGW